MERIELGGTDLSVAPLCVGTWQLSGAWGQDTSEARAAVRRAWDLDLNFFDTAYAYGFGAAETGLAEVLGDLLSTRRSDLAIITKGGIAPDGPSYVRNSDPAFLRDRYPRGGRRAGPDRRRARLHSRRARPGLGVRSPRRRDPRGRRRARRRRRLVVKARSIELSADVIDRITTLGRSVAPLKSSGIASR